MTLIMVLKLADVEYSLNSFLNLVFRNRESQLTKEYFSFCPECRLFKYKIFQGTQTARKRSNLC